MPLRIVLSVPVPSSKVNCNNFLLLGTAIQSLTLTALKSHLAKESKSTYKEYSLQSKDFPSSSSLEDCLTKVSCYIDSLLISNDDNEEQLDKFNDYSVFDDYESIGFFNEGNNCYQNCVIQVCYFTIVYD